MDPTEVALSPGGILPPRLSAWTLPEPSTVAEHGRSTGAHFCGGHFTGSARPGRARPRSEGAAKSNCGGNRRVPEGLGSGGEPLRAPGASPVYSGFAFRLWLEARRDLPVRPGKLPIVCRCRSSLSECGVRCPLSNSSKFRACQFDILPNHSSLPPTLSDTS